MLELEHQSNNAVGLVPLRVKKKDVCSLLSISSDRLEKLVKRDPLFPRPIKEGATRQAAVYFDLQSIVDWWSAQVEASKQESDTHQYC
ncbi:AlpA family transcriptional regulator [Acinetobacter baumannii]|uniref:helix-turn-helix transcriptional regulator n=1 Tax=Acinetobacter baumannii TaxID=470 RepID=UPI0021C0977D|nr:AlpA family transcriptional regulator [Acinetobacter baumannii]